MARPDAAKTLEQFLSDVHWGSLDVLLVDLPPGTGDVPLSLLELLPEAALLAVTTPQPAAWKVASRVGRLARDARMPIAGIVENMSSVVCVGCGATTSPFGSGGGQELATRLDVPLLAQVPLDEALRVAGDAGEPVVRAFPGAPSARGAADAGRRAAHGAPRPRRDPAAAVGRVTASAATHRRTTQGGIG